MCGMSEGTKIPNVRDLRDIRSAVNAQKPGAQAPTPTWCCVEKSYI